MGKWFTNQLMWVANINKGSTLTSAEMKEGEIPVVAGGMSCCGYHNVFNRKGNVITISASGANAGNVQFYDKPIFATDCSTIYSSEQSNKYLFYWLQYKQKNIYKMQSGLAQPHVYPKDLAKMVLTLPEERREQEKIAEILGEVDKAIDSTKKLIDKYSLIKEGMLQDLLTNGIDEKGQIRSEATHKYKDSPLGRIPEEWDCVELSAENKIYSGSTPSTAMEENWEGDIIWITPNDLSKLTNRNITTSERKLTKKGLTEATGIIFPENSVITSCRAPVGYCAIVKSPFSFNQGCKAIINNNNFYYEFIYYYLSTCKTKLESYSSGTTFLELSKKELERFFIPKPIYIEQQEISYRFISIDEKIEIEEKYLAKLQLQKQALMQDLLTNKVSVDCLL